MSLDSTMREFEKKVLAALGLADVPVKSVTVFIAAGRAPEIHVEAYMRNEQRMVGLARAITELRYQPVGVAPPPEPEREIGEEGMEP